VAEPFLGEVRMTAFNFAPKGWAQCNGQLLPINQNQALFSLLGTTFEGAGVGGRTALVAGHGG
jgi:microcystin-dependent protein